jgi:hypothetical protein
MTLRPFFSFYGGKWRSASRYPLPLHGTIVEPFAGSAGYSVRHHERSVVLCEIDPVIAGIWSYLVKVSPAEILSLPARVDSVEEIAGPQEARWLVGFWLNGAVTRPRITAGKWARNPEGRWSENSYWGQGVRDRIARQVEHIRHWKIICGTYDKILDMESTWFIDPPYSDSAGRYYRFHDINYPDLSSWCLSRSGQVIVCERQGANWMSFENLGEFKSLDGSRGKKTIKEAIFHRETIPS